MNSILKRKKNFSWYLLILCLFFPLISGCSSTSPHPKEENPFSSIEAFSKEASKTILAEVRNLAPRGRIGIIPLVNDKGKACHLGKKMANQMAKYLSFSSYLANPIYYQDITYQNLSLGSYLALDFVIAGKIELGYQLKIYLKIFDLKKKREKSLPPYFIGVTDYFRKLYHLYLPQPSKAGLSWEEGKKLAFQLIWESIQKKASLRRLLILFPSQKKLQKLAKYLYHQFQKPEYLENRCFLLSSHEKMPPLKAGEQMLLKMIYQSFGKDRFLITFFLTYPKKISKEHFTLLFYQGGD